MKEGTLTQLFFDAVDRWAKTHPAAYRVKTGGAWRAITHKDAEQRVRWVSLGLRELGIKPGERVSILSETRPEWAIADFACLCAQVANVPIYPALTAKQTDYIPKDSGAVGVCCSTSDQVAKVQWIKGNLPQLKHVIAFAEGAKQDGVRTLAELEATGRAAEAKYPRFREEALALQPGALATLIYTSGTTGDPKGVMLTHNNIWSNVQVAVHILPLVEGDECLAMLPLAVADKLVFAKLRARTGGRVKYFISGSAALSGEIAKFFCSAGLPILEGYGLPETSPVLTLNPRNRPKPGPVGPPVEGVELRIAPDGEILARGPNIMHGDYNKPVETKEAIDADGWFHTGDIGEFDADGYLKITDRKKDLIKTEGGKYIAPQPIENAVKLNKFIANAVVLGERRKYPCILIVPNFDELEKWARERNLAFHSHGELIAVPDVKAKVEREVMGMLRDLAKFEMPKKVILLEKDFTIESGELTPTLKVKRRAGEEHYNALTDNTYTAADPQHAPRFHQPRCACPISPHDDAARDGLAEGNGGRRANQRQHRQLLDVGRRVDADEVHTAHPSREADRVPSGGAEQHDVAAGAGEVEQRLERGGVGAGCGVRGC